MQPLTKYVVKEFEPGKSQDFKIHLADDYSAVFMDEGAIWHWIKRAARSGLEICVYRIGDPILLLPSKHGMSDYLILDDRRDLRAKSIAWADDLEPWIDLANAGEQVSIHPLTCVLDLS